MRIARLKSPRYDSAIFNFENSKNLPLTRSAMVSDPLSESTPPLGTKKQVTLSDIAQHVGVGLMTVSRALRKPELVSEPLRAKILAAVNELGYVRNRVASGLASGRALLVPVVVPTLKHSVYIPFLEGVYSVLSQHHYQIILGTTEYLVGAEYELVDGLLGWRPDGLFLSGVDHSARTSDLLRRAKIPIVEVMDLSDDPVGINVGFSHYQVGVAVVEFFRKRGYRNIGYGGTLTELDLKSVKRIAGFQQTLKEHGLPYHFIQRSSEPFSIALGGKLLGELLGHFPDLEAIFFANDDLAAGALFECLRLGIRVPAQLAIMGFNDQEIARSTVPTITSVSTPRREIGRIAAEILVAELKGRPVQERRIDLGFEIIERESTRSEAPLGREGRRAQRP
jgi:LacI family transcriptional regulator, gluconate utilization system Gnt-I transcriptional repressor